ncbi:hypothetical protein [Dyadobacter luticola]|uniref:SGNH/GDSL hydrolase family protein n=1 Tax=Dyadobacter luticola TaxID=1979387 RepID=A0A5R9KS14_9BACT|nr:hypothetical protein [Dyadobacter luticola]TLU98957.1 hypothetical protein FEN17_20420 [Dyadobacter luticola]
MSSKISKDSLPDNFYNLSFDGLSALDGLLILEKLSSSPKQVFIETNILMRREDKIFQSALFSPVMFSLKRFFESFRESHQPVEVLARITTPRKSHPDSLAFEPLKELVRDEAVYRSMLKIKIDKSTIPMPEGEVADQMGRLKKLVTQLQARGVQVVFFEVPVDPAACGLAAQVQLRQAVKKVFKPLGCKFISVPDCNGYITSDGTHLDRVSAYKFLNYFRHELEKVSSGRSVISQL